MIISISNAIVCWTLVTNQSVRELDPTVSGRIP